MQNQFLEMGMSSIVFVYYKDTEGTPVLNRFVFLLLYMYVFNLSYRI